MVELLKEFGAKSGAEILVGENPIFKAILYQDKEALEAALSGEDWKQYLQDLQEGIPDTYYDKRLVGLTALELALNRMSESKEKEEIIGLLEGKMCEVRKDMKELVGDKTKNGLQIQTYILAKDYRGLDRRIENLNYFEINALVPDSATEDNLKGLTVLDLAMGKGGEKYKAPKKVIQRLEEKSAKSKESLEKLFGEEYQLFQVIGSANFERIEEVLKQANIDVNKVIPKGVPNRMLVGLTPLDVAYLLQDKRKKSVIGTALINKEAKTSSQLRVETVKEFVGEGEKPGILAFMLAIDNQSLIKLLNKTVGEGGIQAVHQLLKDTKLPNSMGDGLKGLSILDLIRKKESLERFEKLVYEKLKDFPGEKDLSSICRTLFYFERQFYKASVGDTTEDGSKIHTYILAKDYDGLVEHLEDLTTQDEQEHHKGRRTDKKNEWMSALVPQNATDERLRGLSALDLARGKGIGGKAPEYVIDLLSEKEKDKFGPHYSFFQAVVEGDQAALEMLLEERDDKGNLKYNVNERIPDNVKRKDLRGLAALDLVLERGSRDCVTPQDKYQEIESLLKSKGAISTKGCKRLLLEQSEIFKYALEGDKEGLERLCNGNQIDLNQRVPIDFPDGRIRGLTVLDLVLERGPEVYATPSSKWEEICKFLGSKGARTSVDLRKDLVEKELQVKKGSIFNFIAVMDIETLRKELKETQEETRLSFLYELLTQKKLPKSFGADLVNSSVLDLLYEPEKRKKFEDRVLAFLKDSPEFTDRNVREKKMRQTFDVLNLWKKAITAKKEYKQAIYEARRAVIPDDTKPAVDELIEGVEPASLEIEDLGVAPEGTTVPPKKVKKTLTFAEEDEILEFNKDAAPEDLKEKLPYRKTR
ncbi:MAG: hypothetical protein JSS09_02095 [Verrucomicrobia bacterium]|nr:hypothetical protein [Verrucomicrobiota bacterium]